MKKGRINKNKLLQLLGNGQTLTECAKYFGVSVTAVHKAKKLLGPVLAKELHLRSAGKFVDNHLNSVEQLKLINRHANDLLDRCMRLQDNGDENAKKIALKCMNEIRGQLRLQNETLAMLAEMSAVVEFQQELIAILKEVDENVCNEFISRINKRRSLRGSIKFD